jgi:hypothetical protein
MGSNFFQRAFEPWKNGVQGIVNSVDPAYTLAGKTVLDPATLAGKNSWIAKEASYDPLMKSGAGKYIDPSAANVGQQYAARHDVTSTPPAFAGVNPTLQDATNGYQPASYVQQSQKFAQAQQQQRPQQNLWGSGNYGGVTY